MILITVHVTLKIMSSIVAWWWENIVESEELK